MSSGIQKKSIAFLIRLSCHGYQPVKEKYIFLPDILRLIGHAIAMTSWFGIACVWCGSMVEFQPCILWLLVQSPVGEIKVYNADET